MDYDLTKGAEYATYIFPFIWDSMLRFRMGEEKWSVSSLTNYKMVRSMAWLYHNTKDAVNEFSKKYNCDLALAEEYLKVVRGSPTGRARYGPGLWPSGGRKAPRGFRSPSEQSKNPLRRGRRRRRRT